ncbi:hypothetical protein K501DRAFT_320725 [Backusella circina FSU 941]|nr:hypothetical protein K501DRAFT_320725 [Backusella circina FSU 941]
MNPLHEAQHSNPLKPRNQLFTCLACQVAFPTTERQRTHYRTDWHKYNLKRKIAQLPPVAAEQFAQKVLAQQAKGKEEEEKSGTIYECMVCRKSYYSENAFSNHLLSKKHKDLESKGGEPLPSPVFQKTHHPMLSDAEEDLTDNDSVISSIAADYSKEICLFCCGTFTDFETNLKHMTQVHGFFLPDVEYLEDPEGLVSYLAEKISDCICLYCNGRGKEWKSQPAVRKHMLDKGHCKMAYDETEDPEALLRFYNFGSMSEQDFEASTADTTLNNNDELILASGERLGHRRFMRYFKQRPRRPSQEDEESDKPLSIAEAAAQNGIELPEPRNRKERRRLALTDGRSLNREELLRRLPEVVQKQDFQRQTSMRNNLVATSRLRIQNPI